MRFKNIQIALFAVALGAVNAFGSVGTMGTPGLFANVLNFNPAKLVQEVAAPAPVVVESSCQDLTDKLIKAIVVNHEWTAAYKKLKKQFKVEC